MKPVASPPPLHPPSDADIELRLLMEAIYLKYSYDFRNYTGASQKRRVTYALEQLGLSSISVLQLVAASPNCHLPA